MRSIEVENNSLNQAVQHRERTGLIFGCCAVLFWSFGSALIFLGARETGTWRFVAIATLTGGALQLIWRRLHQGELRSALLLPWRLWAGPLLCFTVYGLAWPYALALATASQAGAVNLINYLWPILTGIFGIWLVPGLRLTPTISLAIALSLAGLLCANAKSLHEVLSHTRAFPGNTLHQYLPFGLALIAAVTWAAYSALLARWKSWARNYVTSPVGFVIVGIVACGLRGFSDGTVSRITNKGLLLTLLYGAGPLAAGYLLWESALPRAKIQTLSLIAAATPVLSTVVLSCCLRTLPGPDLGIAALLISAGVVLSRKSSDPMAKEALEVAPADTETHQ